MLVEARLDLDEVLAARKAANSASPPEPLSFESLLRVAPPDGLAFFRRPRLPLAYQAWPQGGITLSYINDHEKVGFDEDGRLVRSGGSRNGVAEEIHASLPRFDKEWGIPHPDHPDTRMLIVLSGTGTEEPVHLVDTASIAATSA